MLSPFEVRVGNSPINATHPPNTNGNLLCNAMLPLSNTTHFPSVFNCSDGPVLGRYVSVQRVGYEGHLSLCDVKVGG